MRRIILASAICLVAAAAPSGCDNGTFPVSYDGLQISGLHQSMYPATSAHDCADLCCDDTSCEVWQFAAEPPADPLGSCWLGTAGGQQQRVAGWVSRGGRRPSPPSPGPPPAPTPVPSGPLSISLPKEVPPAKAIPFNLGPHHISPDGININVDSVSLMLNDERWIPTSGEIHHARLPAETWREELLKMKAGGLDTIGAYAFWIHYEEEEGKWDFSGRRDLRKFVQTVQDVGLKVLIRVGPWCHGEARNGGHPDWLLTRSKKAGFALRSNNSQYLAYVEKLYAQFAMQLDGMWWDQGGPIFAMQVDNETPDWQYILALKDVALAAGMRPAVFTKTGWPTPNKGYPNDYPMLPFFGGYMDNFWNNALEEQPSKNQYFFGQGPSLHNSVGWDVPDGYPWLDIEIGGGMAVAYNHRPLMASEDMPSAHLTFLANGVNGLGYYMYHGGNNPHSKFGDNPEHGLQESSFQPAGAQNPMNSISYDFFAPLGEFGQARHHYHQMRRLHLFVRDFGASLAAMPLSMPQVKPSTFDDVSTLRWAVRSNGHAGFLFINNYERLSMLPSKSDVRFKLNLGDGSSLEVPHENSSGVTIASGVWAHWPFNLQLQSVTLSWATAQVLSKVQTGSSAVTLVLSETKGVPVELGIADAKVELRGSGIATTDDQGRIVIRNLVPSTDVAVAATAVNGTVLNIIVLPHTLADKVWKGEFAGKSVLALSDADFVLHDKTSLHIRSQERVVSIALMPSPSSLRFNGTVLKGVPEGAFMRFSVPMASADFPAVSLRKLKDAAPAREVPKAPSGKGQEPTAAEWQQAAVYALNVDVSAALPSSQVRLAVRYHADAARIFAGNKLLTDNWFTGYAGDGQMEVGLTYLAGEVPQLLQKDANLTLHILPLRQDSLKSLVFVDSKVWPDFKGQPSVCDIGGVDVLQMGAATLEVADYMMVI